MTGRALAGDDGEYAVRGLLLAYPGVDGYPAGGDAPLHAVLYNDSKSPVTVTVTSEDAREVVLVATNRDLPATATPDRPPASGHRVPAYPPSGRGSRPASTSLRWASCGSPSSPAAPSRSSDWTGRCARGRTPR
ncbi:hypothetical protein ACFFKH_15235 [Micromonospora marina]|uniref:hypothetical protein n=1 Tax=Micromonospora TaxID=1873 RepID=UPI0003813117|nr:MULTISPECIES: hypothetical protein [Micromonospora]